MRADDDLVSPSRPDGLVERLPATRPWRRPASYAPLVPRPVRPGAHLLLVRDGQRHRRDDRRHRLELRARLLALARNKGWDRMREDQRTAWEELWQARIVIDGADRRWQAIADASLFYLLTSVHPASIASTRTLTGDASLQTHLTPRRRTQPLRCSRRRFHRTSPRRRNRTDCGGGR